MHSFSSCIKFLFSGNHKAFLTGSHDLIKFIFKTYLSLVQFVEKIQMNKYFLDIFLEFMFAFDALSLSKIKTAIIYTNLWSVKKCTHF